MSQCLHELSFEETFIKAPEIEEYIGPNWVDFEISSDCEENIMVAKMSSKFTCNICSEQFRCKLDLQAHELAHQNQYLYQCHIPGCNNRYKESC